MYLGIDIGGTKVLLASFDSEGQIVKECKFPTAKTYKAFLQDLAHGLDQFKDSKFKVCCCAITAVEFDRISGVAGTFGNLEWTNVPIAEDVKRLSGAPQIYVENDAKLAALYEANVIHDFKKLLYLAIGTGIGIALVVDGIIDTSIGDAGGRGFMFNYDGQETAWDDIASGRTLAAKYGLKASEITDPKIWQEFVVGLARGLEVLIGLLEPDVVVVGGGVGAHFEKFEAFLNQELQRYKIKQLKSPRIIKAHKPEEAVIYGCYDFIIQHH